MELLVKIVLLIGGLCLIAVIIALPVMWLWNWLMPEIFGLIEIDFLQALGLSLLTSFLFKSSSNSKE